MKELLTDPYMLKNLMRIALGLVMGLVLLVIWIIKKIKK